MRIAFRATGFQKKGAPLTQIFPKKPFLKQSQVGGAGPFLPLIGAGTAYPVSISPETLYNLSWRWAGLRVAWSLTSSAGSDTGQATMTPSANEFDDAFGDSTYTSTDTLPGTVISVNVFTNFLDVDGSIYPNLEIRIASDAGEVRNVKDDESNFEPIFTQLSSVVVTGELGSIPMYEPVAADITGTIEILATGVPTGNFKPYAKNNGADPIFDAETGEQLITPTPRDLSILA